MKKWLIAALLAVVVPATAHAITIERIAAVAGDDIITLQDLRDEGGMRYTVKGLDIHDIDSDSNREEKLESLTRELVQVRLIARQAKKNDIKVGDREVDMQLSEIYRRSGQSEQAFKSMLEAEGIDWSAYRKYMRGELETQYVIRSELAGQVQPSEADVIACAQEAAPGAERGISVTISQIVIPEVKADSSAGLKASAASKLNGTWWNALDEMNERYASGVQELAAANPDRFLEYVQTYSTGRSRDRNGLLGTYAPGDISADFNVVFTLPKDSISPLVTTSVGYHILRVDDVIEGESESWKKAVNVCREQITMRESQRLIESWLSDLMEKNYVSITVNNDIKQAPSEP